MTAPTATAPCNGPRPDVPFEIPAAPPPPTFRWRRVLRLLGELRDPDKKVDAGLELFDALGGVGGERTFQRFAKSPEGPAMLRVRPDLAALLGDRSFLAALPEGSIDLISRAHRALVHLILRQSPGRKTSKLSVVGTRKLSRCTIAGQKLP